ncbi:nicotinate-nucleotide--dimethylbenzimidazole phosphoribosyltransferase [Chloroflexota bacterium]
MNLLENTIITIGPLDAAAMQQAKARQDMLTKPAGSLGRLEELSIRLAGIQGKALPSIRHKAVITMAGDHGVIAEGISNWPQEVTAQMVYNFLQGDAGITVLARLGGLRVIVVDMGIAGDITDENLVSRKVARGTANMAAGPAMTLTQARTAVETGIEIALAEAEKGVDILATGDMGIGNTTPSSAIAAVMTGKPVAEVTGLGTGLSDQQLAHKVMVIEKALKVNQPEPAEPLAVLACVGGFEIGGLAGVMLGAASRRIPVMVDGFISGAAALIACGLAPTVRDYLIAAHLSAEGGHRHVLEHLGMKPLLELEMRLGEGTGAALGIYLAEAACRIINEMATFSEAGVSEKDGGSK